MFIFSALHRTLVSLLTLLCVLESPLPGQIIPLDRITNWRDTVGVEGGIPTFRTAHKRLAPTNSLADINNAIASCPPDGVVHLSAGVYRLDGQILFNGKSRVVLRGDGTNTVLVFTGKPYLGNILIQGPSYRYVEGSGAYASMLADWLANYEAGASNLVLSTTANLSPGYILTLDQVDDNDDVNAHNAWEGCHCGRHGLNRSQQQYTRVLRVDGNSVSIWPPVLMPNWRTSQSPQAWWLGYYSEYCGVENLTIDGSASAPGSGYGANVQFVNAWNCWVRNITSIRANVAHVCILQGGRSEVRHSYFYGSQTGGSMSYGVLPGTSSGNLIEDNIFNEVTSPIVFGPSASGNVISYNFVTNLAYSAAPLFMNSAVATHNAHDSMNLIEGNYINQVRADYFHGSSGYNTVFRNRITGWETGKINGNTFAIRLDVTNRWWTIVGNVLGTEGETQVYDSNVGGQYVGGRAVFSVGWNNPGACAACTEPDARTLTTMYRHGNYDVINKRILWDPLNAARNLPVSLVYDGKPIWFGDSPWPAYDPGAPEAATATNIPAGFRFYYEMGHAGGPKPPPPSTLRVKPK